MTIRLDSSEIGINLTAAFENAVSTSNNTALLSRPNMLIMDREHGYITVGQNVPFLVASEVTSGGNSIQRIERRDVGVTLEVVPHIVADKVVLTINQESSTVTNSTIASDIITNKRTLTTTVILRNGETIVLGGLISSEKRNVESGVPVLKDIPLMGDLFRSTSTNDVKKELKMIIKTTLL